MNCEEKKEVDDLVNRSNYFTHDQLTTTITQLVERLRHRLDPEV